MKNIFFPLLIALSFVAPVVARDTELHLPVKDVLDDSYAQGKLDGSVKFYFSGQATPAIASRLGQGSTHRKTNAVGKSDSEACRWVMLTALMALQKQAKEVGADAVIDISSAGKNSNDGNFATYECHAGSIMAGVALRGSYVKLNHR